MKCTKCQTKNSYKSNYCYKCGKEFTKEEQEAASNSGLTGILKSLKKVKDILTSDGLKGSKLYKIGSIVIIFLIGLTGIIENGTHLKIEESQAYTYKYNKDSNEYYLFTDEYEAKLNLYALNVDEITIRYYIGNILIEESIVEDLNDIKLLSSLENSYYTLSTKKDTIKIHIYNNKTITSKNI